MGPLDHVRGYCVVFGARSVPIDCPEAGDQFVEIIDRGYISWLASCSANYGHAQHTDFGDIRGGGLDLWTDRHGVAFSAAIPRTVEGGGFRNMIASGQWGVSPMLSFYGRTASVEEDGTRVVRVTGARIEHISITGSPAYPATACWLASMPAASLPEHARAAARRWNLGRLPPVAGKRSKPEPIIFDGVEPYAWASARGIDPANFGFLPELMLKLQGALR